jgi:uncharacterized protein YkwD
LRHRPRASLLSLLTATLAFGGLFAPNTPSAVAAQPVLVGDVRLNSYEAALLTDVNRVRQEHDLPSLTIAPGITDVARRWTWHLAGQQRLEHNPDIEEGIARSGSEDWDTIEENVGYGPAASPRTLFEAYMHSPVHRANILRPEVRYVGIGIVQRGSFAWNTIDFVDEYSSAYGQTRVPADGISRDAIRVSHPALLAAPSSTDQRFGTIDRSRVASSRTRMAGGAAQATLTGQSGQAGIVFRQAMDLTGVSSIAFRLSVTGAGKRAVPVSIVIGDGWRSHVVQKVQLVSSRDDKVLVPAACRHSITSISLLVGGREVSMAGGRLMLSISRLRAVD